MQFHCVAIEAKRNKKKYFLCYKICDMCLVPMKRNWVCEPWVVYTWFWGIYIKQVEETSCLAGCTSALLTISGTIVAEVAEEGNSTARIVRP
jgi:hypothetical protein